MARKKVRIGDAVSFNFAGLPRIGILEEIELVEYGTISNLWYKVRHQDGTIYPCREEALTIING